MPTPKEAVDTVYTQIFSVWSGISQTIKGQWPNKSNDGVPPNESVTWYRVSTVHKEGAAISLPAADGSKLWQRKATTLVEIFLPAGEGITTAYSFSRSIEMPFVGKTINNVDFRKVFTREVGNNASWFQVNVLIDFEYMESV